MSLRLAGYCLALLLALTGGLVPEPVLSDVFVVTKETEDDGPCTPGDCALREAVLAANARLGADVIEVPPGTYPMTASSPSIGDLDLLDDVEIIAPGGAVIVGSGTDERPIFQIFEAVVRLEGLTITGGRWCCGAAIRASSADVVLDRCWVTRNEGTVDGAIFVAGSRMEIVNSTISNNTAFRRGGAICRTSIGNIAPAFLTIRNSTISGNSAREGGAISSFGGGGDIRIENSTIANNPVRNFGSVIFIFSGQWPTFVNSILEGDCVSQSRPPVSEGGNVDGPGETHCRLNHPTDLPGQADLGLLPLDRYGGLTPTHALDPTSPAIDHALDTDCPATDQRGLPRPFDGDGDSVARCDAGAVEYQGLLPSEIPVLSPGAVLLLAGLLALAGLAVMRRP